MYRLQPLLHHQILISSLSTYQDFIRKRPKKAFTFKFSAQECEFGPSKNKHNRVQAKLFKALDLAKPLRKVDLTHTELQKDPLRKNKLLLILKRISKVKVLSIVRKEDNVIEKSLRYFRELQHLSYKSIDSKRNLLDVENNDCEFPFESLRYCLKLQKLLLGDSVRYYCFNFKETAQKLFVSDFLRKNFMINHLHLERKSPHYCSIQKYLNRIISMSGSHENDLKLIQTLSNIQEISLNFPYALDFDLGEILQKVVAKRALKKLKLSFDCCVPELGEIFKALRETKLTHFALKTLIKDNRNLGSIAGFLKHMYYLESLKLDIENQTSFNNTSKPFIEICQQINRLEKLQHLKFALNAEETVENKKLLGNFLSNIYPVFTKLIKLKTLSLSCNQLDHSEAFPGLITALKSLHTSLQKLKIDLGNSSFSLKSQNRIAVNFMKSLSNIKVLKLPGVTVNSNKNLTLSLRHFKKKNFGQNDFDFFGIFWSRFVGKWRLSLKWDVWQLGRLCY